jgi:hypothetical protein
MSKGNGEVMTVTILPNTKSGPQGKLADAEVIFGAASGPLNGLRLIGFAVWERCDGGRKRDVSGSAVLRERRTP